MFGMDAMVDQAGRVWLLELNCDPDLKVFDHRFNHVAKVREHLPPPSRTLLHLPRPISLSLPPPLRGSLPRNSRNS
jgi:hypothetical protein